MSAPSVSMSSLHVVLLSWWCRGKSFCFRSLLCLAHSTSVKEGNVNFGKTDFARDETADSASVIGSSATIMGLTMIGCFFGTNVTMVYCSFQFAF